MDAILLVDHGSRIAASNDKLQELARALGRHLEQAGRTAIVAHAHMELAEPSVQAAVQSCIAQGARLIVGVPCFLARGRHVTEDIPRLFEQALRAHPEVGFRLAGPLSEQPGFLELLARAGGIP
jgi:sirohydrochlorin ferrochelatase